MKQSELKELFIERIKELSCEIFDSYLNSISITFNYINKDAYGYPERSKWKDTYSFRIKETKEEK